MLNYIIPIIIVFGLLVLLYKQLLEQSKHPTGMLGILMMKLWNKTYLPMVKWVVTKDLLLKEEPLVLDVGVGNGQSTRYLASQFRTGKLYGIDISSEGIAQARKQSDKIIFEEKSVAETGYSSEFFDYIFAMQTHFHWEDFEKSLRELKRVLKEDGTLIMAAEKTKVHYYFPQYTEIEAFDADLHSLGFKLIRHRETGTWIAYYLQKID